MIPKIIYPIPFDNWSEFKPYVDRFAKTLKQFPPGIHYELFPVSIFGTPTNEVLELFYDTKARWGVSYWGNGCDAGCWQTAASKIFLPQDFIVCCTSRVFFFKENWLEKLVEARESGGAGVYSTSASKETQPHLCLRCVGVDAEFLATYPVTITDRPTGRNLEVGDLGNPNLAQHVMNLGGAANVVYRSGRHPLEDAFEAENIFRRGDQSNLLVHDRHTEIYREADAEEKKRLERLTFEEESGST